MTALRYTGGANIYGVPGRDLTAEEAEKYRELIEESPQGHELYVPVEERSVETEDKE